MIFLSLVLSISWTLFVLFIWFRTDWLLFYAELLGLSSALRITEFRKLQKEELDSDFLLFLWIEFGTHKVLKFPAKLFTCFYCLGFWVSFVVSCFYGLELWPLNYLCSVLIFRKIKRDE